MNAQSTMAPIDFFEEISVEKPADLIIKQISDLIVSGKLKPGQRLPSEAALAERFGTGRGYIRQAISKLVFYGIVESLPQRGTFVSNLGLQALEGLVANIITIEDGNFESMMEARALLETYAASQCAIRASDEELLEIEQAHRKFASAVEADGTGIEEDVFFHLKIAEHCKNGVIRSLISLMAPDIIKKSMERETCADGRNGEAYEEHQRIMAAFRQRDSGAAEAAMRDHIELSHFVSHRGKTDCDS